LFHVSWVFIDSSEEGSRRSLKLLSNWQPPEGAEFRGFYGYATGGGGFAIIEADRAGRKPGEDDGSVDAVASIHGNPDPADRGVVADRSRSDRVPRLGALAPG
jgi:hypothetical protein